VGKQTVINYVSKRKMELSRNPYKTAMYGLHVFVNPKVQQMGAKIYSTIPTQSKKNEKLQISQQSVRQRCIFS
jgi:hypothetical protein